jgi:hypothetical protein
VMMRKRYHCFYENSQTRKVYLCSKRTKAHTGIQRKKNIYANLLMQCKLRHVWISAQHSADSADIEQNVEEEKENPINRASHPYPMTY